MYVNHPVKKICVTILSGISIYCTSVYADDLQFNTDLLDVEDKENIEKGIFSKPGYIMPGYYNFKIYLNNQYLVEQKIEYLRSLDQENQTEACITPDLVEKFGLVKDAQKRLLWNKKNCLILSSLDGVTVKGNLPQGTVNINVPQAYLEYRSENWDPAALWDNGINGVILDYNIAGNSRFSHQPDLTDDTYISANGVAGLNLGAWRIRADWQTNYRHVSGFDQEDQKNFDWSRFYAYRAIPELKAQLILGETFLNSDLFDSFRFTGASLRSDVNMLPPNLRGYAPQVTGIAQTNATVIVSQLGRVLYQTQVPAGPFKIQDLNDSVSGTLNVRVEEEDGMIREFTVETASIPFLTRPGSIRYKTAIGRPTTYKHHVEGDLFLTGEFSWGISNGWSLFGGSLNSNYYNALSVGIGRDLLAFGAISFDVTQSFVKLQEDQHVEGRSYRVNYAKRFEELNSQIQFAGYRFSEKDFMTMNDYLASTGVMVTKYGRNKEMYSVSLSQNLPIYQISISLNLNHQTYWDFENRDYYSLSLNKTLNSGWFKDSNLAISAYKNKSEVNDSGAYISLSVPLNSGARVSYSAAHNDTETRYQVGYFDRYSNATTYQVNANYSDQQNKGSLGGFVSHSNGRTHLNANINYLQDLYTTIGGSVQGGLTLTMQGVDLHRSTNMGGTRLMVDTDKVSDIPVSAYGVPTNSNLFGKAVITDVSNYSRNKIKVDINKLPKNAEVIESVLQASLTQGAIGYRKLHVISGQKKLLTLAFEDGSFVPFGTPIENSQGFNVGMADENGLAYLGGIRLGETMIAQLGSNQECLFTFTESNLEKDEDDPIICELNHK